MLAAVVTLSHGRESFEGKRNLEFCQQPKPFCNAEDLHLKYVVYCRQLRHDFSFMKCGDFVE